jgi:hypothetical protein
VLATAAARLGTAFEEQTDPSDADAGPGPAP